MNIRVMVVAVVLGIGAIAAEGGAQSAAVLAQHAPVVVADCPLGTPAQGSQCEEPAPA
jgi:hypothetical protein